MAELVFTDAFVSLDGNDLSDHVRSVTLDYSAELLDATAMGVGATRTKIAGFKDWTVALEFNQDFAAGNVDAILFPLVGTTFACLVRPVKSDAISATNPQYTGDGTLETYSPFGGGAGAVATTKCTIRAAGSLTRDVTP